MTLGEGATPLLPVAWLSAELGAEVWLKDEGLNPTGSFKARGAAVGVARAKALGAQTLALPTAGNAGAAWAAYGARAGLPVVVAMPKDAPALTQREVALYGARLHLVDGLISDAGAWVAERRARRRLVRREHLQRAVSPGGQEDARAGDRRAAGWRAPDVILYPTGGGVGLIGLWKAFAELRALGWLDDGQPAPRLVAVQAAGCAPVVRAWEAGETTTAFWEGAQTVAAGLRVPGPLAGALMLRVLRETQGTALAVSDDEIRAAVGELARAGLWVSPEGAALLPGGAAAARAGLDSRGRARRPAQHRLRPRLSRCRANMMIGRVQDEKKRAHGVVYPGPVGRNGFSIVDTATMSRSSTAMLSALSHIRDQVLAHAQVTAGDVVLDIGAGDGLIPFGALPLVGEQGKVIISDISADLLEHDQSWRSDWACRTAVSFSRRPPTT